MKMRRCEDEKMFYRLPLLEEPCAQTRSGKMGEHVSKTFYVVCCLICFYVHVQHLFLTVDVFLGG